MTAAEKRAFDAANKTVREWAIKRAQAENKLRVADVELKSATDKVQVDAAAKAAKATTEKAKADAIRQAQIENKSRIDAAKRAKQIAQIEVNRAQKAEAAIAELHRRNAINMAERARKLQGDPLLRVWTKAKEYLDKGEDNFNDIRNKLATDLGMKVNQVTRLLAQDARAKTLTDDLLLKQQKERRLKEQAKRWVTNLDIPGYQKAIASIPRVMFSLKVGFHGTVALGTHAPTLAFQPRFWNVYAQNFAKMYRLVGKPTPAGQRKAAAFYEQEIQDLMRRKNYGTAKAAGLVNDPFQYEEYHVGAVGEKLSTIAPQTAEAFNNMTRMGNRGYSVLKILRQDMFDQQWNKLPKTGQTAEMAQAIADGVNHATGVVKGRAPPGTNILLFAPKLEFSRFMWLAGDPIRAAKIFGNWKNANIGERAFAMNQIKEKAWVFGTLMSLLALNQGMLAASGSKQKINGLPQWAGGAGFDPMESDFLKFKVAGMNVAYGNAMVAMARLPVRMAASLVFRGKTSKLILEDERIGKIAVDYVRSQLSPFAGTLTDLTIGRDYAGRPLPRKGLGLLEGDTDIPKRLRMHGVLDPYTWTEYGVPQILPIPFAEGIKEVWGNGMGMPQDQMDANLKALAITSIMALTGGRIAEDYRLQREE